MRLIDSLIITLRDVTVNIFRQNAQKKRRAEARLSRFVESNRLNAVLDVADESVDLALVRLSVLEVVERNLGEQRVG